jgi:hypothetical protein
MMRVRNLATLALILMIGVHALLTYSPIERHLPAYILRGLDWFYGAYWFYGTNMPDPMVP